MKIRSTTAFMLLAMSFLLASSLGLQQMVLGTAGGDLETVQRLAEAGEFETGNSYLVTAFLYTLVPDSIRFAFVWLVGCLFLWFCFRPGVSKSHGIVFLFLSVVPCLMAIATFQKDLLLVAFIVPAVLVLQGAKGPATKLMIVIGIYLSYAVVFRLYFAVIAVMFAVLLLSNTLSGRWRLILWGCFLILLVCVPIGIWQSLQESRDIINARRIYEGQAGARTAFLNPYPITSFFNFCLNYAYSIYRLNLSFFGSFDPKDGFFLVYVALYYRFVWYGLLVKDPAVRLPALLILAHALVLHLFEPDVGSYARHLSTTLPYLALIAAHFYGHGKVRGTLRRADA